MLMYKNEVRINYGCWDVNGVGTDANNKRKRIMKGKMSATPHSDDLARI